MGSAVGAKGERESGAVCWCRGALGASLADGWTGWVLLGSDSKAARSWSLTPSAKDRSLTGANPVEQRSYAGTSSNPAAAKCASRVSALRILRLIMTSKLTASVRLSD